MSIQINSRVARGDEVLATIARLAEAEQKAMRACREMIEAIDVALATPFRPYEGPVFAPGFFD